MKQFLFIALLATCSSLAFAQKALLGKIIFKASLSGEGAEMAQSMMPDSYEYWVGKGSILFKVKGGLAESMMGEILVNADGSAYLIKHSEKVCYILKNDGSASPQSKAEAEDEVLDILGYACRKYKIETQANGESSTQYAWVTDKYKINFMPKGDMAGGAGGLWINGVKGIPLKVVVSVMGMTSTMTASELTETKIPKSAFKIPKDYEKKEFDPKSMMGF